AERKKKEEAQKERNKKRRQKRREEKESNDPQAPAPPPRPLPTVFSSVKHFLAMPLTLLLLPIVFFVCADAAGLSLEDCRARGLVPYPRGSSGIGEIWQIVNYHEVQWGMLPRQIANLIGLIIIVTFGSSLDVAAIQAELPTRKLDYNKELTAIGWGNLCSSFVCGATGSYIFSQTIFSAKRSVKSRFNGFVVAIGEFLLFGLPVDILKVLPNDEEVDAELTVSGLATEYWKENASMSSGEEDGSKELSEMQ
ncbi:unnamed protein product, partial [Cladocopium goreaui]